MTDQLGFETRQIHAGQEADPTTGSRAVPIYQTTSYQFRDADHAANLFALAEIGNIYTRIMNPTQGVLEARLSSLEGGTATAVGIPGALCVSSGQAAETLAILNLCESGGHVVASPSLYGGTYNLLHYTLPKMGIEVDFVSDPHDLDAWDAAVKPNTKAFYGETLANPATTCSISKGSPPSLTTMGYRSLSTTPCRLPMACARWNGAPMWSCTRRPSSSVVTELRSVA